MYLGACVSVQLGGLGAAGLRRSACWVAGAAEAGSFASERSPAQVAPAGVAVFSFLYTGCPGDARGKGAGYGDRGRGLTRRGFRTEGSESAGEREVRGWSRGSGFRGQDKTKCPLSAGASHPVPSCDSPHVSRLC